MPDATSHGSADTRSDDDLVTAVRAGDREAFGVLFGRWFDRVYDVARNIVRSPETAADVAQDTFIAAWERIDRLEQVESFGGWLLRIARNKALDRLARDARSRPQGDAVTELHDAGAPAPFGPMRPSEPDDMVLAADRDGIVHAAAVALGARDASLLDLHLRHGLTPSEIAEELGVTPNNAHQLLFRMRARLATSIGAYLLWSRGRPACSTLGAELRGTATFDATAMAQIERHSTRCAECSTRRGELTTPELLFSALPIAAAPLALRDSVRQSLASHGVPIDAAATSPPAATWQPPPGPPSAQPSPSSAGTAAGTAVGTDLDRTASSDDGSEPVGQRRARRIVTVGLVLLLVGAATIAWWPRSGSRSVATFVEPSADADPSIAASPDPSFTVAASVVPRSGRAPDAPTLREANDSSSSVSPTAPPAVRPPGVATPTAPPQVPTTRPVVTAAPPAPVPTTTAPPAVQTAPSTTDAPAVSTTTPAPSPPPPTIVRFWLDSPPASVICSTGTPRRFRWTSTDASGGTLTFGGLPRTIAATGTYDGCAPSGSAASLQLTGPGGSDSATLTLP